jgi:hypothetical protein
MSQVPEVRTDRYLGRSPLPEVDDEGLARAKRMPGGKLAYFDANYPVGSTADDDVRPLQGFRVVGPDGTFTGEEWTNPDFVPHPDTAGITFHTDFELQLWRTINGYLTLGPFVRALAGARLMAMVNDRGELEVQPNEHGDATLDVYTSLSRVPSTWPHWKSLHGRDVVEHLGRTGFPLGVQFNRHSRPRLRMPARSLAELWTSETERIDALMRIGPLPTEPAYMGTTTAGGQA